MLVGVLAQVKFPFRGIVLPQAALDVVGVPDVEPAFRVFENIDVELGHEKSVIG